MTALMIAIATQPKNATNEGPGSVGTDVVNGEATRWMSGRAYVVKTLLAKGADLTLPDVLTAVGARSVFPNNFGQSETAARTFC